MNKAIWAIFWALVGYFILLAANLFLAPGQWGLICLLSLPVMVSGLFFALGVALIVLTLKSKPAGWLRTFLIMTGAAPIAIPIDIPFVFPFLLLLLARILVAFQFPEGILEMTAFFILYLILLTYLTGIIGSIVLARREICKAINRSGKLITTSFTLIGIGIIVFLLSITLDFDIDMNVIGFSLVMVGLVILIVGLIRRKKLSGIKRALLIALASVLSLPVLYLIVSYTYYIVAGKELGS
jgi:hypothetical protein